MMMSAIRVGGLSYASHNTTLALLFQNISQSQNGERRAQGKSIKKEKNVARQQLNIIQKLPPRA